MRAAASDQGVTLVTETLAWPELDRGNLKLVLDVAWPQEFASWLVRPRATAYNPKTVAFRDWQLEGGAAGRCSSRSSHPKRQDQMP
jgi:DNA-binding transcriptional LysR family regulator